mmetsp:Transcript_17675/g.24563  ORF Transcript_17675/g.24563 Transcript_17675/m.24563 type:complete len:103 (-) Transcript_17675:14-322(-)
MTTTTNTNLTKRRVKVYQLDSDNQWEDKGTGHVYCVLSEKYSTPYLLVKSEKEAGKLILETKVFMEDIYILQADTLIVWNDPETDTDLALSFQEAAGCQDLW